MTNTNHLELGPFVVSSVKCWDKTVASSKLAKVQKLDTGGKSDGAVTAKGQTENGGNSVVEGAPPSPIKSHLSSSVSNISTGLGFLDHMVDQLNSHAQIGVSISVGLLEKEGEGNHVDTHEAAAKDAKNRFAHDDQDALMELVGMAIGEQLYPLLPTERRKSPISTITRSRFCCPLDEALVECNIAVSSSSAKKEKTPSNITYKVAPYGMYPKNTGRTQIGHMKTAPLQIFWTSLAKAMQLDSLELVKLRGHNGHHLVESSFKAFSRALRCLIDGTSQEKMEVLWGKQSNGFAQGVALKREATISRSTKETSIDVKLKMDGGVGRTHIETDIPLLDELYETIVKECECMSLQVNCKGDLWVDDHHTSEDVSIAIGQVLNKALGSKAGLNRMWTSSAKEGDAEVEVVMDLSNRPCFTHNLEFGRDEMSGGISMEMVEHVFDSLVMNGHMTVHVVQKETADAGATTRDVVLATARAFGAALNKCIAVDPRRAGKTASSKGTLSV